MRFVRVRESRGVLEIVLILCGLAGIAFPQKSKKEETQTLQEPRDLPAAIEGDPRRLTFLVSPLSSKGLLTKQVRDALTALNREAKGDTILKIRAFVAGPGDGRRVRDLVSEIFTERKQPLPVLSLVQSGGLPDDAQVVLEAIASAKKEVNPYGLAFLSAATAVAEDPTAPIAPLLEKSLAGLRLAVKAARSEPADVMRASCFLSSLDDAPAARKLVSQEYPDAAINLVQSQRSPSHSMAACEAVARLRWDTGARLTLLNPDGLPAEAGTSRIALVASPKVVLTGSQVSFGYEERDGRLAFERLEKELEQEGVSLHDVAFAHFYPLATPLAAEVRKLRGEFFDPAHPPATSLLLFEGLSSMNAGFAMDVVAVK